MTKKRTARGRKGGARRPSVQERSSPSKMPAASWLWAATGAVVAAVAVAQMAQGGASEEAIEDIEMEAPPAPAERFGVRVVRRFPHDSNAFTQGLLWHDGRLYESTGMRGRSTLRQVDLATGRVLRKRALESRFFAEGLARVDERLIQLTWTAGEAHVWSLDGFEHMRRIEYEGEGWGLCYDGEHLVMSDGSDRLTFRDPESFRVESEVRVRRDGAPLRDLNELECVDGAVWANVWRSDEIVRIDPASGRVTDRVDASGLLQGRERIRTDVLNGIAWLPEREHFVLTGKLWPYAFEVELVPEG